MDDAIPVVASADIMVVIGTSLNVYPAAGLINYAQRGIPIFVIDPERPSVYQRNVTFIQEKAGKGVEILKEKLKEQI
jgi:NAD-dependent deacetylase